MNQFILECMATAGMTLIGVAVAYATLCLKKLKAKAEAEIQLLRDKEQQNLLREALWQLDDLAEKTVGSLEQTVGQSLRKAVKSGQKDRNELLALLPKAAAEVYAKMKPEYLASLEQNMAGVEKFVLDSIESKVLEAKAFSTDSTLPDIE